MAKNIGLTGWRGVNITPMFKNLYHKLGHFAQTALQLERVVAVQAGRGRASVSATCGHDYGLLVWWEGPA
eukprot:8625820-Alexandrium_andersonii.AAC.1